MQIGKNNLRYVLSARCSPADGYLTRGTRLYRSGLVMSAKMVLSRWFARVRQVGSYDLREQTKLQVPPPAYRPIHYKPYAWFLGAFLPESCGVKCSAALPGSLIQLTAESGLDTRET